jgi:hypothetical protein
MSQMSKPSHIHPLCDVTVVTTFAFIFFGRTINQLWEVVGRAARNQLVETTAVAGHVRLELRNIVANYPFERSRRFPGIQPNSGHRDHSRLSCGAGPFGPKQLAVEVSRLMAQPCLGVGAKSLGQALIVLNLA